MQDYIAKQAARASAAAALQAANPHLVPVGQKRGKNDSLNAAAKNIQIELKAAFPGVKFSVKSSRFSGGDSIDVRWTDGPVSEQVDAIIDRYSAGYFDGMNDIYEYSRRAWTDAFGNAKYIHSSRDLSDKAIAAAIRTVKAKYAGNLEARGIADISIEDYRAGRLYMVDLMGGGDYWSLGQVVGRTAANRTWALTQRAPAAEMVEALA